MGKCAQISTPGAPGPPGRQPPVGWLFFERRKVFEADVNIEDVLRRIEAICVTTERIVDIESQEDETLYARSDSQNDNDMFEEITSSISAVKRRENVSTKEAYFALMRITKPDQREMVLEVIHRHHLQERDPIQVFLTGAAGCGKTFLLKILMETYNRYLYSTARLCAQRLHRICYYG